MKFFYQLLLLTCCSLSATAFADSEKPSIPSNVNASALSDTSIRVSWNAAWDNTSVSGYNVYRDNAYHTTVFSTNYIDRAVVPGASHAYQIVAFDQSQNFSGLSAAAQSNASATASIVGAVTPNTNRAANMPSGLQVSAINGNELRVQWSPTANASGYNIYRDGNYYTTVNSGTSMTDRVDWGRDYRYAVSSFNANNQHSATSPEVIGNTSGTSSNSSAAASTTQSAPFNDSTNSSTPNNSGAPAGYNLVFNDDFRGYSLDSSKWNTRYRWGPDWIINGEQQYYVDALNEPNFGYSPFEFDGENLTIKAIRTPDWLKDKVKYQPYLSGALTTHNKFTMRYGYVEMRAKLPRGQGLWPAFWLLHNNDHERRPEIDIMEMLGGQPDLVYHTYHHYDNGNLRSTPSMQAYGPDYSADFHTYAVKWEPGKIIWYIDGEERNRYENGNVSWEDMYLLVNLAIGGWWAGSPDGSTPFPAQFSIDYIRAWKKP